MKSTSTKASILGCICLLFNLTTAMSQTTAKDDAELKKATEDFKAFRYVAAISRLSPLVKSDTTNVKAMDMLAYSYKMTNNYKEALTAYEQLSKQKPLKPEWALNYAEQLAVAQQYEKSENWYRKYLLLTPGDKRAANFANTKLGDLSKNGGHWTIGYLNINTMGSEYSPVYYNDGLLFASNRQSGKFLNHVFEWDNTPFTNLYSVSKLKDIKIINADSALAASQAKNAKSRKTNVDDTAPTSNDTKTLGNAAPVRWADMSSVLEESKFTKLLNGSVNSKYHNGSASVFPDGSIIFTRNNYFKGQTQRSTDGIIKLKLYTASGENLSKITEFPYNSNEYSVGHPALNKDGNILIMASDMPGGFGGTDLYYSVRSGKGPWTRPVNLGKKINTEGNEMFPFLDKEGNLYFASNGHAGLGGLDLFKVALKEMKAQSDPVNMGTPINSSFDDFGLTISDDGKSGYFSSNRKGSDDIYNFKGSTNRLTLEGTVYDAITKIPLAGSRLLMRHLDGVDTIRTNAKGYYKRDLPRETDYEITAQKLGYVNKISFVSSVGIVGDTTLRKDIYLNKAESLQQYVISNCDSLKKVFAVKNIYYDLDRSEIRADARPALDELVRLMTKYPEISVITSSHTDSRATEQYNRALSFRRGEAAKSYLIARGISPSRISIEYYGKTRLVNRCFDGVPCSEENQQLNRRTEFDVILNGVNITRQNCEDK
ncbi:OmpA family protein [Pedobacter duraquae]|uniref:Outer membrane protein OmpA-like peptidoglycan-associated protein n=1 Tax=Pedobacter duraquae TaxID=425511 RepID=A0A4R6IP77_9SPHI|nr:OmpA family protein [Pedobacter duraquae]TDO24072.1 outer membrane protein OmpA-like peptidoglycan-associated protein [Pedobacter duraquae]